MCLRPMASSGFLTGVPPRNSQRPTYSGSFWPRDGTNATDFVLVLSDSSARNCRLASGSMGPAFLKFTWLVKLLLLAADVKWLCPLNALVDNTTGLLAAGSTFGVIARDFLTVADSRFDAIVCSMTVVALST